MIGLSAVFSQIKTYRPAWLRLSQFAFWNVLQTLSPASEKQWSPSQARGPACTCMSPLQSNNGSVTGMIHMQSCTQSALLRC